MMLCLLESVRSGSLFVATEALYFVESSPISDRSPFVRFPLYGVVFCCCFVSMTAAVAHEVGRCPSGSR